MCRAWTWPSSSSRKATDPPIQVRPASLDAALQAWFSMVCMTRWGAGACSRPCGRCWGRWTAAASSTSARLGRRLAHDFRDRARRRSPDDHLPVAQTCSLARSHHCPGKACGSGLGEIELTSYWIGGPHCPVDAHPWLTGRCPHCFYGADPAPAAVPWAAPRPQEIEEELEAEGVDPLGGGGEGYIQRFIRSL